MTQYTRHPRHSHRPVCPDPTCGKVWAPTKRAARDICREVSAERGSWPDVRFYEHAGGWHWSRMTDYRPADRYHEQ